MYTSEVASKLLYILSYINYLSHGKNMHWSHSKRHQVYYNILSRKLLRLQINTELQVHSLEHISW